MDLVFPMCYLAFVTAVFGLGDNFNTLNNVTSWEEANKSCTLATPRLNYSRQGLILDFGDDLKGTIGEYWVGYTTHNFIFQYIGCNNEADVPVWSTGNFTLPYASPGVCYSACHTDVFGLMDAHCYCMEARLNDIVSNHRCNLSCFQKGTKCGGERAVSIFEESRKCQFVNSSHTNVADLTMSNFTSAPTGYKVCIAYDPLKQAFIWEECDRKLRAQRCQTSSGKSWSDSADYCFSRRDTNIEAAAAAADDDDAADSVDDGDGDTTGPYWTEYFRSDDYIRTFKDHGTPVLFGYVKIPDIDGQSMLMMSRDKTNLDAICFEKQDATTTTIQSTPSTPEKSASAVSTTTAMESNASTQESKTEYLLVKIGVPLLILACVVVAVVAGIICYRRRRSHKPSTQAPNIVEHYSQVQDPYDEAQNVYNEPFDKVIERKTNTSEHARENRSMPNDEDEYDTTGAVGNIATERGIDDNVYNKLELVTDDTYDRANGPKGQRNAQADKPGPSNAKAGHGVVAENTYDRVDTEEGSYSHVNAGIIKQETTDNVYN